MRARKFITQVGLSGVYDTFRLDAESFSIPTIAIGGACTMDFERFLDGAESLSDLMNVLTDSLTDAVYIQVQKALIAAASNGARPAANLVSVNTYSADDLFELMGTVRAYGPNVVIFAAPEFIAKMGADAIVPVAASGNPVVGVYSPDDIENIHRTGYVRLFRGAPIVQIPQSFIDETNTKTWINPQYAYVLPAGKEKVVKVVLEGDTQMWAEVNKDRSIEVNAYKKMGCAVLTQYNWGIYQNKEIPDTSYNPYGF